MSEASHTRLQVGVFTPLPFSWPHALCTFSQQLSIIETPVFEESDWKTIHNMRAAEERVVLDSAHWICVQRECAEFQSRDVIIHECRTDLRTAMLGFQIWVPKGWIGILIGAELVNRAWRVVNISYAEAYGLIAWAKFLRFDDLSVNELGMVIDGTLQALACDSVACKNPFGYLEIGLQTAVHHLKAGGLFWMIGLDALVAAQQADLFAERLCRLLGADTKVFPVDYAMRQPAHTVGELAGDIYQLRNQIAHGDRIRPKYMEKNKFRFEPGSLQDVGFRERSFQMILCEAALFMLCGALRKVIVEGHLELLADQRSWKKWLDGKMGKR